MKTSELEGAELDLWVAKATGDVWGMSADYRVDMGHAPYSTVWEHGGPIIEREFISIQARSVMGIWAAVAQQNENGEVMGCLGPTPLIAAMRAYVASKFGPEVG